MPKFFFDIAYNGDWSTDRTGVELATEREARAQAARTLGEISGEEFGESPMRIICAVRDADGSPLFQSNVWFEPG